METNDISSIGVLADDLTSAADGASPFVAKGYRAVIGRRRTPKLDGAVVAVDSGSRSLSPSQVPGAIADLTSRLASRRLLYKTTDSTLRGHVTAELEASFHASGRKMLVFAPAFPAAGRTTVGGIQLVDGAPVSESAYGSDPVHPARTSVLAELIPTSIRNAVVLDASTQGELDCQVRAIPALEDVLWVGSPGMAEALARRIAPGPAPRAVYPSALRDILVVIGTANRRSHQQAVPLQGMSGVTLLRSPSGRAADSELVLSQVADDAMMELGSRRVDVLIATGGDTIEAILDRLGVREFEVLGELEAGFPLGRAVLGDGRVLVIAMKAGGFGDEGTLHRAVTRLQSRALLSEQVQP